MIIMPQSLKLLNFYLKYKISLLTFGNVLVESAIYLKYLRLTVTMLSQQI